MSITLKQNHLLAGFSADDCQAVTIGARVVSLKQGQRLYRQDGTINYVYFPLDCVVSVIVGESDPEQIEMASIGNEGMAGVSVVLDVPRAEGTNLVQVPGEAVRMSADAFRRAISTRPTVQRLLHRYLYALMRQIIQTGACNRLHSVDERCARWLLMTHDRVGVDTFPLTQEFLAVMLAVRRPTVNLALSRFKKAQFIHYVRGTLSILDRPGLESVACTCYATIRDEYQRVAIEP